MTDQLVKPARVETPGACLVSGDEYKERLRDDREVWFRGERIKDVTTHDLTCGLIEQSAQLYDDQFTAEGQKALTYQRPDGTRAPAWWLIPATPEDLVQRRLCTEYIAWRTGAVFGRAPDCIPWTMIGLLAALESEMDRLCPEYKGNLRAYLQYAEQNGIHLAGTIIEPQGDKARAARAGDDRSAVLRIVDRSSEGIRISGARAVGSYAAQANDLLVGTVYFGGLRDEEAFWCCIPLSSPGLKLIAREGVSRPGVPAYDHPVMSRGDEIDSFVIFDNVFVPRDRVFSTGFASELHGFDIFNHISRGEHWQVLNRLTIKAELMLGLLQLLVDTLGTSTVPTVQDNVGKLIQYAQILRSRVIAAEHSATELGGVLLPDVNLIAAVRSYGLEEYPRMVHLLQELCGQGLVMRFSAADVQHPELLPYLEKYLSVASATAEEKNRLMNAIWDFTSSEHAGRTALFENVNALPAFSLRQRLYREYDRSAHTAKVREFIGFSSRS